MLTELLLIKVLGWPAGQHTCQSGHIIQQGDTGLARAPSFDKCEIQVHEVHDGKLGDSDSEVDKEEQANVAVRKQLPRHHGSLVGDDA